MGQLGTGAQLSHTQSTGTQQDSRFSNSLKHGMSNAWHAHRRPCFNAATSADAELSIDRLLSLLKSTKVSSKDTPRLLPTAMGASASASAHGPAGGVYVRRVCTHFGVLPWRCKASACTNTVTNPVFCRFQGKTSSEHQKFAWIGHVGVGPLLQPHGPGQGWGFSGVGGRTQNEI